MSTQRIPIEVLGRLVEQTRPVDDGDFASEEVPVVLMTVDRDGVVCVERVDEPTQRTLISEILAASTRVVFG